MVHTGTRSPGKDGERNRRKTQRTNLIQRNDGNNSDSPRKTPKENQENPDRKTRERSDPISTMDGQKRPDADKIKKNKEQSMEIYKEEKCTTKGTSTIKKKI